MSDAYQNYWTEAAQIALDEAGVVVTATTEQWAEVGSSLYTSRENESMMFGPAPSASEIHSWEESREAAALKEQVAYLEAQVETARRSVAQRRRVPIENVFIDSRNDRVEIR